MSPNQRGGDRIAGMGEKTSPCKTSVLNLGKTPRVPGLHVVDKQEDATKRLPAKRDAMHSLPTNRRILAAEYRLWLASSSSAEKGGRHYVRGYLH